MRRPQGYGIITEPGKADIEFDTYTCNHCNTVVRMAPMMQPEDVCWGIRCKMCNRDICRRCVNDMLMGIFPRCVPWEQRMERMESRDRFLRAVGAVGA